MNGASAGQEYCETSSWFLEMAKNLIAVSENVVRRGLWTMIW